MLICSHSGMYIFRMQHLLINVQTSLVTFLALKEQFTVTELKENWVFFISKGKQFRSYAVTGSIKHTKVFIPLNCITSWNLCAPRRGFRQEDVSDKLSEIP